MTTELKEIYIVKPFIKPVLAASVMAMVIIVLEQLPLLIKIVIGIGVYGLASYVLAVFEKEELMQIRRVFAWGKK